MTSPRMSVVVPVYNGARYLRQTLEALLAQTMREFELLVIDDGSTDGSADVVRALRDSRVRLMQGPNQGLAHALNRGLAEASASYVVRNDQDDVSVPHRLERQLRIMESRSDAIALFAHWTKFGSRRDWSNRDTQERPRNPEVRVSVPLQDGCLLASTMCARTAVLRDLGGYRQEYYPSDDWDLQLRLSGAGTVLVLPEPLVAYRFHAAANTYRLFAIDQDKGRWAEDSYRRRCDGLPELPFEVFLQQQASQRGTRWARRFRDSSKLHMRLAGQNYLDGRDGKALLHGVAAACLNPVSAVRRAVRLLS